MKPKKKGKGKKPDYRKTETFQDYKSAAATFADFNPGTDTVFVGTSLDPGMAHRKANYNSRASAAKGASSSIPSDNKMYKTKNESGQTVYVSLNKNKKYSKGGMMKPKYKKGGKLRGKTVTKEMVDKEFAHNFEVDANLTNKMAKQAATGLKDNGFPMKPANVTALREQVKKHKEKEGKAKPSYKYVAEISFFSCGP